jgi:hypothetical protein
LGSLEWVSGLDRAVGREAVAAAQRARLVRVRQRRDRLPAVGAQARCECGVVAEGEEDAAFGLVLGAEAYLPLLTAGSSCSSPTGIA